MVNCMPCRCKTFKHFKIPIYFLDYNATIFKTYSNIFWSSHTIIYWPLIHNKFIFYLTLTVWTVLFFYSLLFFRESVFNSWSTCKTRKRVHEWTTCIDIFYQYFLIKKLEIQCGKPETSFSGPKTKFVSSFFSIFCDFYDETIWNIIIILRESWVFMSVDVEIFTKRNRNMPMPS